MFMHVSNVEYQDKYKLRITFADGAVKIVDLARELDGEVFEPLRDLKLFRKVRLNKDTETIEWPNGADMAPEFLYEIGVPIAEGLARRVAESKSEYGV